ncbi:MAG: aldehyde dehydrogenase (NADP(+)) [Chloroflexi bacterium]|nr:MAG: aldehyde dehydrogenase (NADP(+)) [Chloroflexota bacterium]
MPVVINGRNQIANKPSNEGRETFTAVNPRTKQTTPYAFFNAITTEIDQAVRAATDAFAQSRHFSAHKLAEFLDQVAAEIENLGDQLLHTADEETGLGIPRLTGERGRTTGQLRKFGELLREGSYVDAIIDTAQPDRQPLPRSSIRRQLFPLGPVAVFSASNFPFAFSVAGGDTASAFAAGCPVVVKAHPCHPATSELFAHAINRAIEQLDFPAGFFSLIQGNTIEVGQTLVTHPGIAAVGFTGSLRAGRAIYDAAAARPIPIPVFAEMGSVNPVILLPNAVAERGDNLAAGLVQSLTLGSGQFCTNPGLVLMVKSPETDAFIKNVAEKMNAQSPGVLLNGSIEQGLANAVATTVKRPFIQTHTGGEVVAGDSFCYANTVLQTSAAAFCNDPLLQEEHFGPVTLFVVADSMGELETAVHALHGNLTATIHAAESDLNAAQTLLMDLKETVGRLIWNGFPTGVEVSHAMQHGGPYPATTAPATTSVGMTAIKRFMRPVAFQDVPDALLPPALQDANPLNIWRIVDGDWSKQRI